MHYSVGSFGFLRDHVRVGRVAIGSRLLLYRLSIGVLAQGLCLHARCLNLNLHARGNNALHLGIHRDDGGLGGNVATSGHAGVGDLLLLLRLAVDHDDNLRTLRHDRDQIILEMLLVRGEEGDVQDEGEDHHQRGENTECYDKAGQEGVDERHGDDVEEQVDALEHDDGSEEAVVHGDKILANGAHRDDDSDEAGDVENEADVREDQPQEENGNELKDAV